MRGFVGPALIENKITQGIKDGAVAVDFGLLPDVRMMAMNYIGAGIDKIVGQRNPPGFGIGAVFVAPVKGHNKPVDRRIVFSNIGKNLVTAKIGVGNKIVA